MIKYAIAIFVVLGALGGAYSHFDGGREIVEKVQTEVVEKVVEKEVPTLDKRIADAISASSTDIETEARQAYEEAKKKAETEIALRVTTEYRKEVEQMEAALEEQVSF